MFAFASTAPPCLRHTLWTWALLMRFSQSACLFLWQLYSALHLWHVMWEENLVLETHNAHSARLYSVLMLSFSYRSCSCVSEAQVDPDLLLQGGGLMLSFSGQKLHLFLIIVPPRSLSDFLRDQVFVIVFVSTFFCQWPRSPTHSLQLSISHQKWNTVMERWGKTGTGRLNGEEEKQRGKEGETERDT